MLYGIWIKIWKYKQAGQFRNPIFKLQVPFSLRKIKYENKNERHLRGSTCAGWIPNDAAESDIEPRITDREKIAEFILIC